MPLFAIADLHLYKGIKNKPMDVFGPAWDKHMERLAENWRHSVTNEDTVLIPGDISWATYLEQVLLDLEYIDELPGKKIISKGNHDYWWTTLRKMNGFVQEHEMKSISFLHNHFFSYEQYGICGTRLWDLPGKGQTPEDEKIFARELIRLEISLEAAEKEGFDEKIVMLHYPPARTGEDLHERIAALFEKYHVVKCVFGHVHHTKNVFCGTIGQTQYVPVMADYIDFSPLQIGI